MFYINKLLIFIGLLAVLLSTIVFYLLFKITNPEANNIKSRYDAIVILSGNPERAVVGSKLFFDLDAKFIYLSKENSELKNYSEPSIKKKVFEQYIDILIRNDIPKEKIILFGINNTSTHDEAKNFNKTKFIDINNVLIVTDKFHIYRAKKIFSKFDYTAETDFFYPEDMSYWYEDKRGMMTVLSEIMKCFLYYIFIDFDGYLST